MKVILLFAVFVLGAAAPAFAQVTDSAAIVVRDSMQPPAPADFTEQTYNGTRIVSEEGIAAFFPSTLRGKSIANAFHNTAPRGTIIEVTNTNNGRRTYVKVIGTIPASRMYYNCIIGISAGARKALGAGEGRTRCTLRFGGY